MLTMETSFLPSCHCYIKSVTHLVQCKLQDLGGLTPFYHFPF